ncbi:FAD-dependent oxidoreductase [Candidatus Collierbacteria bacterium]|nr:FAD-dependent oxidoreductase [Candidatus Collierbacteria bacterium]
MTKSHHKLIIIGSGPAAWTAAIYAARAELKPLVLAGEQSGGQLMLTTKVENYPGFADGVMGQDLMAAMRQQAEKLGVEIIDQNATALSVIGSQFSVVSSGSTGFQSIGLEPANRQPTNRKQKTLPDFAWTKSRRAGENGKQITAKAVILATGASAITLKLPGEDRLMGRGVGTCAVCDAPFYKGKDTVFIIGGGDSAIEEAMEISKFASNIIVLVRKDSMRASPIMQKRIELAQNIKIWYRSEAIELLGDKRLEKVKVNKDGIIAEFSADGLFYAIGHKPATEWLKGSGVEVDKNGYISTQSSVLGSPPAGAWSASDWRAGRLSDLGRSVVGQSVTETDELKTGKLESENRKQRTDNLFPTMTSISGIFAAGDCVDFRYRQAIVAAGFGAMAALDCQRWLESQ